MNDHRGDSPFKIAATPEPIEGLGRPLTESDSGVDPAERVRAMVKTSEVFLLIILMTPPVRVRHLRHLWRSRIL